MKQRGLYFYVKIVEMILLASFLKSTVVFAGDTEADKKKALDFLSSLDFSTPPPATVTDPKVLRQHFERNIGVQLNRPGRQWHPLVQKADSYVKEIISELNRNNPRQNDFHWIVEIRESAEPMAAAELIVPDDFRHGKTVIYENLKLNYGVSGDKPIALIHVSTALFKLVHSRSQLAFILGHEMKHHSEGHTKDAGTIGAELHSQSNEVVADKGSLDFMGEKFNLDAGYTAMANLLSYQVKDATTIEEQVKQIEDSVTSSHHHAGLRLTFLLQAIVDRLDKNPRLKEVGDQPLPHELKKLTEVFIGKMPRSAKRDFVRLLKEIKTASANEVFQRNVVNKFSEFFRANDEFWNYKDTTQIFSRFLTYLSQHPDGDRSARVAFLFLMSGNRFATQQFFEKIDASLSRQLSELLSKLNDAGITKEKVWPGERGYIPTLAEWRSQLGRLTYLKNLISQLAERSRGWAATLNDIHAGYTQNQKFSMNIDASTEWGIQSASAFLFWLESATEAQLREQSGNQLPSIIEDIKNPKNYGKLIKKFGQNRINKLIKRLEEYSLEYYQNIKNAAVSAQKPVWEPLNFINIWIKLSDLGLSSIKNDQVFLLKQFLKADIEHIWQAGIGKKDLENVVTKLYSFVSTSGEFNINEKIEIYLKLTALEKSGNSFAKLFREDKLFRQRTAQVLNNEGLHQLLFIQDLQVHGEGFSAKMKIFEELQLHGLLTLYLSSNQGKNDFLAILQNGEEFLKKGKSTIDGYLPSNNSASFILSWLGEILKGKSNSKKELQDLVLKTVRIISTRYDISPEEQKLLSPFVSAKLKELNGTEKLNVAKLLETQRSLSRDESVSHLADGIMGALKEGRSMNEIWDDLSGSLDFKVKGRDLALSLRNVVAQQTQVQPGPSNSTLPIPETTETERAQNFTGIIRMWSGVASMIQSQSFPEQLEAIDYFMGRSSKIPQFIYKINEKNRVKEVNIVEESVKLRSQLAGQKDYVRATFINSILVGSQSKVLKPENREKLMDYLLNKVDVNNRTVARDVTTALIEAEGARASVLLSQVLASKNLDEAKMIQVALGNYFVPGMKFGQYLAFVGDFKAFESTFADFQDAAPVPGYYEIMTQIYNELNGKVDLSKIRVIKLLGAGTVNIAVEYLDLKDNKLKVINISREKIVQRTEADFARFKEFVRILATKSSKGHDYNFVVGLTGLIERSIKLEFDRRAAFQRLKDANQIYSGQDLGGWRLQTVTADSLHEATILMGKAPGITAKKLWEKDKSLYKNLMSRFYVFEYKQLFNMIKKGQVKLANPDLHDGQVIIDEKLKTITVIDFGQALLISPEQSDMALEIVSIVSGLKTKSASLSYLNRWVKSQGSNLNISEMELQNLLTYPDAMDRFMRLISLMNLKKAELPLESIQMVLQINRLAKLGEKTGRYPKVSIGLRLVGREIMSFIRPAKAMPVIQSCEAVFKK